MIFKKKIFISDWTKDVSEFADDSRCVINSTAHYERDLRFDRSVRLKTK